MYILDLHGSHIDSYVFGLFYLQAVRRHVQDLQ